MDGLNDKLVFRRARGSGSLRITYSCGYYVSSRYAMHCFARIVENCKLENSNCVFDFLWYMEYYNMCVKRCEI